MNVMVIDDAVTARMMIISILREIGFKQIHAAEDGVRALQVLEGMDSPDLVFVDWNMPYMNGLELVRTLRSRATFDQTSIMMVTTETGMSNVIAALEAGADEYVMKPFTKDILLDKLKILGIDIPAWH